MNVIVCIDDRGGMMFNGRRQSRDRNLYADIVSYVPVGRLYMGEYSRSLFADCGVPFVATDAFLDIAASGDYCFVEDKALLPYADKIESVTVYHWNRHYPSDVMFDIDLSKAGFKLTTIKEFEGYSHEKITKEIYVK